MTIRAGFGSGNQRAEIPPWQRRVKSECVLSKLDPDVGVCAAMHTAAATQQALSASQPAGQPASQPAERRAQKHDRRLSW